MLELVNLHYRHHPQATPLFEACQYSFHKGIYLITGGNGVGKSTLLKLCAHAIKAEPGMVKWQGIELADLTLMQRQNIVLVEDKTPALPHISATELSHLYQSVYPSFHRPSFMQLSKDLLIHQALDHPLFHLSLGQQKKLMLAIAFSIKPALLLLDEPFNALDEASTQHVLKALQTHSEAGGIILIVSHVQHKFDDMCHELIIRDRKLFQVNRLP